MLLCIVVIGGYVDVVVLFGGGLGNMCDFVMGLFVGCGGLMFGLLIGCSWWCNLWFKVDVLIVVVICVLVLVV